MKVIARLLTGLFCIWALASYGAETKFPFKTKEISEYPFIASEERAAAIRSNYKRIVVDMTSTDVVVILGAPDEIYPLYAPNIKEGNLIGRTYWYVLRRLARRGSAKEKREAIVRISFNLKDQVTRVDNWGLDKSNP